MSIEDWICHMPARGAVIMSSLLGGAFFQNSQKPSSESLVNHGLYIIITEELYNSHMGSEMFLSWKNAYLACTKPWLPSSELHEVAVVKRTFNSCTQERKARGPEVQVTNLVT